MPLDDPDPRRPKPSTAETPYVYLSQAQLRDPDYMLDPATRRKIREAAAAGRLATEPGGNV